MILHQEVPKIKIPFLHQKADNLDFDPEEDAEDTEDAVDNAENSSFTGDDESQNDAREHYEDVGYIF